MSRICLCTVILLFLCQNIFGQYNKFIIYYNVSDFLDNKYPTGELTVPVPCAMEPISVITGRVFKPEPGKMACDIGKCSASWEYIISVSDSLAGYKAVSTVLARENTWDDHLRCHYGDQPDPDTSLYLRPELNVESDHPEMIAYSTVLKEKTRFDYVRRIFNAVVQGKKLIRHEKLKKNAGAFKSLKRKAGTDYDYSALMVALCRAAGIPARFVSGLQIHRDSITGEIDLRHWSEVYFTSLGWVTFDPAGADDPASMVSFTGSDLFYVQVCYGTLNAIPAIKWYRDDKSTKHLKPQVSYMTNISEKYFRMASSEQMIDTLLMFNKCNFDVLVQKGLMRAHAGDFKNGELYLSQAIRMALPGDQEGMGFYYLARCYALQSDFRKTSEYLAMAMQRGSMQTALIFKEPDLRHFKKSPEFAAFKKKYLHHSFD